MADMTEYIVGTMIKGKFVVFFTTRNLRIAIIKRQKLEIIENKSMEIKKRA